MGRGAQEARKSNRECRPLVVRSRWRQVDRRLAVLREYDAVLIAEMPDAESWSAVALAVTAGGAIGSGKTTVLMSGSQGVEALKKAEKVAKGYKPAK